MSFTSLPRAVEMIQPVVGVLRDGARPMAPREIDEALAKVLRLSPEALAVPHGTSSRTEFQYRSAWARSNAKRKGLLYLTDEGKWVAS
jgi:restriction system protein